jgi:Double zinc ribbon
MRCSKCAAESREGRKFCAECGASLNARCASCGAENNPTEKFSGECGIALAGMAHAVSVEGIDDKTSDSGVSLTSSRAQSPVGMRPRSPGLRNVQQFLL